MDEFTTRRSQTSDYQALQPIIEKRSETIMSRYGRTDLDAILEEAIYSLTVLHDDIPVGIACFSYPPLPCFYSHKKLHLIFFVADPDFEESIPDRILRTLFEDQPTIDLVQTTISQTAPIENCLRPQFVEDGAIAYSARKTYLPSLIIRAARVEDYDDLMPLFEKEADDLIEQYGKFFVSDLIRNPEVKCLVAEGNEGLAVGFVCLEPNFDITQHSDDYEISAFENLVKQPGISFRIKLFFIEDDYRSHARDFIKPIFALMRDSDYAFMFLPTDSPPFPLSPYFTQIPPKELGKNRFSLFLCHRDSVSDVVMSVRQFETEDYSLLENFVESLSTRVQILEICNEHPEYVYQYLVNEIICGVMIVYPQTTINQQVWDVEEYINFKTNHKHIRVEYVVISPLFQRFLCFFFARVMELLDSQTVFIEHRGGFFDSTIAPLFRAVERRKGFVGTEMQLHYDPQESLHILPRKYILQPKYVVNTNIVLVGSTEGVSSFLYELIKSPIVYYSSLFVVCEGGSERIWVNTSCCWEYPPDWLQHLHLLGAANFFESDLNSIERDESQIILDDGTIVVYDLLLLLTAKQGELADMWMAKKFVEEKQPPVTVIGDSLVAYYLLSHFQGCAHIAMNPRFKLEGTLGNIIKDSNIANCDFKEVSPKLLSILERSSLVYDGGIVIDELFRTNDVKVFAAGPITMFSRIYQAPINQAIISQTEYGRVLATIIKKIVDPIDPLPELPLIVGSDDAKSIIAERGADIKLPEFSTKRAEMYTLPGDRMFYRNGYPAGDFRCLETVNGTKKIRFFVDQSGFIQAFEYNGDRDGSIFNWNKFIGFPAVLLNNMIERFDQGMIKDFSEYFNQEWCAAILHDRFRKFFDGLLEKVNAQEESDSLETKHMIREALLAFLVDNSDLLPNYFTSEDQLEPLDESD